MNKQDIKKILNKDDPIILEIGCNDGTDSKEFLDVFKKIKLYCFEPDVRAIKRFKDSVNDSRCELFEGCVGNVDGFTDFYSSFGNVDANTEEHDKSGSIRKPTGHLRIHPWCKFHDRTIQTKITKLDTWIKSKNIEMIDFIWADVQGAEEDLLEGGIKTITEKARFLYTEYSNTELYEGQINLEKIKNMLPCFEVELFHENNVLLKNLNVNFKK